jgi:hypothetical protein
MNSSVMMKKQWESITFNGELRATSLEIKINERKW